MDKKILYIIFIVFLSCSQTNKFSRDIPNHIKSESIDIYHGKKVLDAFKPLENMNDSLILDWYRREGDFAKKILESISGKELFQKDENKNSIVISKLIVTTSDNYFYLKRKNRKESNKLFYRKGFKGEEVLLFDPKQYNSQSQNEYYINYFKPNWDDSNIVISLSKNDEEISEIIIFDILNKKIHPQVINNSWVSALGGVRWLSDNSGFFYEHIPDIDKTSKGYLKNVQTVLYTLGEDPKKMDIYFSKHNNPEMNMSSGDFTEVVVMNKGDKYLFSNISGVSAYYDFFYTDYNNLGSQKINWKPLFKKEDKIPYFYLDNDDIIFVSAKNASNFRICKTSLKNLNIADPEILVEEDMNATITDFTLTKQGIFFVKTKNGVSSELYFLKQGEVKKIQIPKVSGSINLISKSVKYDDLWIEISGWTTRKERYKYDWTKNTFIREELYEVNEYSNFDEIVIREIEIPSHDGALVPLSLIYNKDIKLNSNNRVLLHGYGAYGFSMKPKMDDILVNWIKKGGIYAIAHVRGGGEKGDKWYKGGYKTSKPNTWKDFIACADFLVEKKYTLPSKIAVWSASAGGILIGRAITERPDLFAAAIIRVGKLNTVRSENTPNGLNGIKEYGSVKDSIEFNALLEMDAYHNIKEGVEYPALLLTAGMNDTRVPAWQPAKFAARMIEVNTNDKPVLFNVDFKSGHGFEASSEKKKRELEDILSFALWQTGHPDFKLDTEAAFGDKKE